MKIPIRLPRWRECILERYATALTGINWREASVYRQPIPLIFIKLTLFAGFVYLLMILAPAAAQFLEEGFRFFRLHEIYKFEFPHAGFFVRLTRLLLLIPLAHSGIFFLLDQIEATFSAAVIDKRGRCVYYVRDRLVTKELCQLRLVEIDMIRLKQNLLLRPFRVGTVELVRKNGQTITIRGLWHAPALYRELMTSRQSL